MVYQGMVYLNQLMSFSAVAGPALLALKQTNTLRDQLKEADAFLDKLKQHLSALVTFSSVPVQVGVA